MRDYLFRGKTHDGKWAYGSLVATEGFCGILEKDDGTNYNYPYLDNLTGCIDGYITPVLTNTVGQFTGICDKYGKRIFEGDIVKLTDDVKRTFNIDDGEVKFNHSAFFVNGSKGLLESLFCIANIHYVLRGEVVGNIHDNPELLKGV